MKLIFIILLLILLIGSLFGNELVQGLVFTFLPMPIYILGMCLIFKEK